VVTIPLPDHPISVRIGTLSEVVKSAELCASEASLEGVEKPFVSAGYVVDVGLVYETRNGTAVGLRFRRGSIYGDLAMLPTKNLMCKRYIVRVQAPANGVPMPWTSAFAMDSFVAGFGRRYFNDDPAFAPINN
jgi:hypothetical protein